MGFSLIKKTPDTQNEDGNLTWMHSVISLSQVSDTHPSSDWTTVHAIYVQACNHCKR